MNDPAEHFHKCMRAYLERDYGECSRLAMALLQTRQIPEPIALPVIKLNYICLQRGGNEKAQPFLQGVITKVLEAASKIGRASCRERV